MEDTTMTKKTYMQPTTNVVKIQHSKMLCSSLHTSGLGDNGLGYDQNGGNQGNAWSRKNNDVWDEEEEEEDL